MENIIDVYNALKAHKDYEAAWYVYLGFGGFALACILVGMIIMRYTAQTQTAWKIW